MRNTFLCQLTPEIIWLYADKTVYRHRDYNIFFSLFAMEIKVLHGDLSVSRPRANSVLC